MKSVHAVGVVILAALFLAAPASAQDADPPTSFRDTKEEVERDHALGSNSMSERDARLTVASYGKCVAGRNPGEARRLLAMDFTTVGYKNGMRQLSRAEEQSCARNSLKAGSLMRTAGVLLSGAMAETLLAADPTPLNVRLARAGSAKVAAFGSTDAISQCLARSMPDQVASLFATEPASSAEEAAAKPILDAVPVCARAAGIASTVEVSISGLRATLATASYRLVNSQPSS